MAEQLCIYAWSCCVQLVEDVREVLKRLRILMSLQRQAAACSLIQQEAHPKLEVRQLSSYARKAGFGCS